MKMDESGKNILCGEEVEWSANSIPALLTDETSVTLGHAPLSLSLPLGTTV